MSTEKEIFSLVYVFQIDRIAGGKFVESWSRYDTFGLMQQLGLIPTPGKGRWPQLTDLLPSCARELNPSL